MKPPTKWTRRNDRMSVFNFLIDTASSVVLSSNAESSFTTAITTLQFRMTRHFDSGAIAQHFLFGPSTRGTILPSSMDEQFHLDYMVVFSDGSVTPQTYLNRLKVFVERRYDPPEIYQSNPTIVLEVTTSSSIWWLRRKGGLASFRSPTGRVGVWPGIRATSTPRLKRKKRNINR